MGDEIALILEDPCDVRTSRRFDVSPTIHALLIKHRRRLLLRARFALNDLGGQSVSVHGAKERTGEHGCSRELTP